MIKTFDISRIPVAVVKNYCRLSEVRAIAQPYKSESFREEYGVRCFSVPTGKFMDYPWSTQFDIRKFKPHGAASLLRFVFEKAQYVRIPVVNDERVIAGDCWWVMTIDSNDMVTMCTPDKRIKKIPFTQLNDFIADQEVPVYNASLQVRINKKISKHSIYLYDTLPIETQQSLLDSIHTIFQRASAMGLTELDIIVAINKMFTPYRCDLLQRTRNGGILDNCAVAVELGKICGKAGLFWCFSNNWTLYPKIKDMPTPEVNTLVVSPQVPLIRIIGESSGVIGIFDIDSPALTYSSFLREAYICKLCETRSESVKITINASNIYFEKNCCIDLNVLILSSLVCEELDLSEITENNIEIRLTTCANLKKVILPKTLKGMRLEVDTCPKLESVENIEYVTSIQIATFYALPPETTLPSLVNLTELNLSGVESVDDIRLDFAPQTLILRKNIQQRECFVDFSIKKLKDRVIVTQNNCQIDYIIQREIDDIMVLQKAE